MITAAQIRAARALLDWKQGDLADMTGLSLPSINMIERGTASPRQGTLLTIHQTFENEGIQFLGEEGVIRKKEIFDIRPFEGESFLKDLYDDIFSCLTSPQDKIDWLGVDERKFAKFGGPEVVRYADHQKKTGFKERILIQQGDAFLLAHSSTYRWASEELIGTIPYAVYKDRFAIILWEMRRTVLIRNQSVADLFRRQFQYLWKRSEAVPEQILNQLESPAFRAKQLGKDKNTR